LLARCAHPLLARCACPLLTRCACPLLALGMVGLLDVRAPGHTRVGFSPQTPRCFRIVYVVFFECDVVDRQPHAV